MSSSGNWGNYRTIYSSNFGFTAIFGEYTSRKGKKNNMLGFRWVNEESKFDPPCVVPDFLIKNVFDGLKAEAKSDKNKLSEILKAENEYLNP